MNYYIVDGQWYSSDELYHHGIKGMKWGIRRYQNEDGTLTAAGKKRLKKYENKLDRINQKIFMNRMVAKNSNMNDPAYFLYLPALSKKVKQYSDQGDKIISAMKKNGLLSDNTKFDDYTAKYEKKVIDDCKKYVSEKYKIKDPTEDDVNYFLESYIFGAI